MKGILWLLMTGLLGLSLKAQPSKRADSVQVKIKLNNKANNNARIDSAYLIFDRHNLTGAGVVKHLVYPSNNIITLENVPEGKFYITVVCLGLYKDSFSETSYVYEKRKNKNEFEFILKATEAYDANAVNIPAEKIDPSKLSIVRCKLRNK